jgi:hypothetical protein
MKKLYFLFIVILLLGSCSTTPKSTVASNVNLSKYKYAAIGTNSTGSNIVLADAHMKIQNALISCGYNVIVDTRIRALEYEERLKLFYVEFSMTSNSSESVCLIYFTDYLSENLIATFRGSYGLGLTMDGDKRGAVDNAIKEMMKVLKK